MTLIRVPLRTFRCKLPILIQMTTKDSGDEIFYPFICNVFHLMIMPRKYHIYTCFFKQRNQLIYGVFIISPKNSPVIVSGSVKESVGKNDGPIIGWNRFQLGFQPLFLFWGKILNSPGEIKRNKMNILKINSEIVFSHHFF